MTTIHESRTFVEAAKPATGTGMLDVVFITEGWGSSGYYPSEMLEEAAKDVVYPAGTQMFINHPTATENEERPVRDLAYLAAVLTEDATYDPKVKGLRGPVKTFPAWRESLAEMAPYIGVSIRAAADVEEGEVDGRKGIIVKKITEGLSIDFVTKAGRGGHVVEVLEHAIERGVHNSQPQVITEALQTDVRDAISKSVRAAYGKPYEEGVGATYVYLRDYDPDESLAYFSVEDADSYKTYQQKFDENYALVGEAIEVRPTTVYVPVAAPSGSSTSNESQEDQMPTIEEARLRVLEAAEAQVATLTQERDAANARAEEALRLVHTATAKEIVAEAFKAADIDAPKTVARLAAQFTLTESGEVDAEALRAIAAESAAEIAEARGQGSVVGFGHNSTNSGEDISEADLDARLAELRGSTIVKGA